MTATVAEQVTAWKEQDNGHVPISTPEETAGVGSHARLGIGLPMSNIFATWVQRLSGVNSAILNALCSYFGGSLQLVSLDGWGMCTVLSQLLFPHSPVVS